MTARQNVILHMGLPKTGSTTIQALLHRNADLLRDHVRTIIPRQWATRDLRAACTAYHMQAYLGNDLSKPAKAIRAATRALLDAPPPGTGPLIISEESSAGLTPGASEDFRLFPYIADIARIILDAAADHDVRICVMTRAYESWLRSVHNQAVRTDACPLDLETFQSRAPSGPNAGLSAPVDALKVAIGAERVRVISMEEDLQGRVGLGTGLLNMAGVPADVLEHMRRPPPQNTSFGPGALEFMRLINEEGFPRKHRRALRLTIANHPELFRD